MTSFLRGSCPHLTHPGPVNFPRARSRGRRVPLRVALAPQARVGVPGRRAHLDNEPTRRPSLGVHVHTSRRVTGAAALAGALWSHAEHPATADYPRLPTLTFLPVLVRDAFHLGSAEFGGALSVFGFGGLVGAAAVLPLRTNRTRQILSNLAALALSGLIVATALGRLFGVALVASNTAANSILQSSIDGRIRGRVSSLTRSRSAGVRPWATSPPVSSWPTSGSARRS